MKYLFITGVSTGIGLASARIMIQNGFTVFGTVRHADRGRALRDSLGQQFIPLIVDVTDPVSVKAAAKEVGQLMGDSSLAGVVNNAGIATTGPLVRIPIEKVSYQFDVNVLGPLRIIQEFLPLLEAKGSGQPGRVINISSIAGKVALPFTGPYSASKFALEALSDSLRPN